MLFYLMQTGEDETKSKDVGFPPTGTRNPLEFATQDINTAFQAAFNVKNIQGFFIALENEAVKTSRAISNGIKENQKAIGETLFEAFERNIEYGASWKDVQDYIVEFGETLGRIPNLQQEVIDNAIRFAKATGLSTKEVGQFVGAMDKIGIGQSKSLEKLNKIYLTGRKYGVDASKLTQDVVKNISKASTYGFKDGIDGLTKMAGRAQQLGISMENALKFSQDVLDPDNAIETAASMQMLGGAVGALGDPFQLLYMAQNDVGALQEEMIKATESAVDFNSTTGEFKIPVSEMYRLKEMAGKLGMSYEEISESAIKAAKQTQVLSMIELPSSFSEEDKNLVASLSEIKGDKVMITIPGQKEAIDAQNLTKENLEQLRAKAETEGKSASQLQGEMNAIAQQQLSAQDKANISLDQIKLSLVLAKGSQGLETYPGLLNQMSESATKIGEAMTEVAKATDAIGTLDTALTNLTTKLTEYTNEEEQMKLDIGIAMGNFVTAIGVMTNNTAFSGAAPFNTTVSTGDMFMGKSGTNKVVQGGFGEFYKLDFNDELLAMPNISKLLEDSNTAFNSINNLEVQLGPELMGKENMSEKFINFVKNLNNNQTQRKETPSIQDLIGGNLDKLSEVGSTIVNQNITSSQKVEGNVGVDGNVNINVNVPNGLLSTALSSDREFQGALKDEIMKVVNYRLSEAYTKGQGNLS
jgi:hypothetical protein